jgi:hypothetical protein
MGEHLLDLLFAQVRFQPSGPAPGFEPLGLVCSLLQFVLFFGFMGAALAGLWKIFDKAGKPPWAALVPFYNAMTLAEVAGRPAAFGLLMCIPCIGIIFAIIVMLDLAKAFGKDAGYGIGLAFLGFIFLPMLGFGSAQYQYGKKKARRRDYEEEDYDEPRPRRRRPVEDDDDDEPRPRRRRPVEDD